MITTGEKNQVRALITSPGWNVVESLRDECVKQIRSQSCLKDTEWETARTVVFNEGQIEGMNRLLQEILKTQI